MVVVPVIALLISVPAAFAATPKQIAEDLADGRLDGRYSRGDMQAFLRDATVQGYGGPIAGPAAGVAGVQSPESAAVAGAQSPSAGGGGQAQAPSRRQGQPLAAVQRQGRLPFTGVDLVLLSAAGALLIAVGLGTRWLARHNA